MDNLPYPERYPDIRSLPPLEIPYICSELLSSSNVPLRSLDGFPSPFEFLKRKASGMEAWRDEKADHGDVACEAQAFLFFGLLKDILGQSFDVNDFLDLSNLLLEPIITLSNLEQRILNAVSSGVTNADTVKALCSRVNLCVKKIQTKSLLANRILLSIEILVWSLMTMFDGGFGFKMKFRSCTTDGVLAERLLAAGWCPHWIGVFCENYSAPLLNYLSGMLLDTHSGHDRCTASKCVGLDVKDSGSYITQHTIFGCQCSLHGPEEKEHKDKVISIIHKGGVPLIKLSETPDGNIAFQVEEAGFGKPFIAISHVWSGGLGNPHQNTIPMCQLKRIYDGAKRCQQKEYGKGIWGIMHKHDIVWKQTKYYKGLLRILGDDENEGFKTGPLEPHFEVADRWALHGANEELGSVYIWFDTFCIPIMEGHQPGKGKRPENKSQEDESEKDQSGENEDQAEEDESKEDESQEEKSNEDKDKEIKMKAINKMAFIYAAAMHILVIDQTLRDVSFDETLDLDLATLFLTSPWMSRSWTFQEGCLARQFSFLLKDNLIDPRRWMSNSPPDRSRSLFELALKAECIISIGEMPDVINNSVSTTANERESRLVSVWNELSHRSTTKPEDVHGILAVMLNLSALEILQIKDERMSNRKRRIQERRNRARRMMAILRGQESLPLSMMLLPYPDNASLVQGYEWISSYPRGALSETFGSMKWCKDGSGLRLLPSESKSSLFVIKVNGTLPREIQCLTSSPNANTLVSINEFLVQVELHPPFKKTSKRCEDKSICLLLHNYMDTHSSDNFQGIGACFVLSSSTDPRELHLGFVCPLTYRATLDGCHRRPAPEVPFLPNQNVGRVVVDAISEDIVCLLPCDSRVWPLTKYRRPAARVLQKSLSMPASILILSLWSLCMGLTFSHPASADLARSVHVALEHGFKVYPKWLRSLNVPLLIIRWGFQYPRIFCALLVTFTRMIVFYMLEYPRLEFIAQRLRYERYAESFDYVETEEHPSRLTNPRFEKEPLYQYQPTWRLCIPCLIAASNLISATWPRARMFLLYLPYSPKIDSKLLSIIGKVIILETGLRIVGEVVWRFLGLDTASEDRIRNLNARFRTMKFNEKKAKLD